MRRAQSHSSNGYQLAARTTDVIEEENEHLVEGIRQKTGALKSLCIDISQEVKEQKKLLEDLDDDFDKSGGFLSSTMGRLVRMSKAGHNRFIFYLILFGLFVFFVIYIIIKFR